MPGVIDDKRLDDALECGCEEILSAHFDSFQEPRELLRLARLGLWAEKQAIPALRQILEWRVGDNPADPALAAPPKDTP